jgi:hypothetical protein
MLGNQDDDINVTVLPPKVAPPTATASLNFEPYAFPDPASIPPRQWLYGSHYIRGAVSASIGAPGRLKSTHALTEVISMAAGRDLTSGATLSCGPLRAAYLNGEETQDELDRRVAAICQRYGITPEDCGDRLWVISTRDKPIRVAVTDTRGAAVVNKDAIEGLKVWCERNQIDVLVVDPLISFHRVKESSNEDIDLVVKEAFGAVAGDSRSVDLVHHPRKLTPGESVTKVDDARGASALLGAVRVARTFNFMTTAEAGQLGIRDEERRRYVKIENGKSNPGPIGKAHWLIIEVENLPNGDVIACSTLWTPPNPFDGMFVADLKVVQRLVQGGAFRDSSQSPDWLGWWMAENLPDLNIKARYSDKPRNKADIARLNSILKTWEKNEVLRIETRKDETRRERRFYVVGEPVKVEVTTIDTVDEDEA